MESGFASFSFRCLQLTWTWFAPSGIYGEGDVDGADAVNFILYVGTTIDRENNKHND